MTEVGLVLYPWLKAAHVIFVIFWVAGLFMLPRFFVYHHESALGSAEDKAWIERETRLRRIILTPASVIVVVLGITLASVTGAWGQGWLHAKLLFVVGLLGYHHWATSYAKRLARGERKLSNKRLRMLNEVPGVVTAAIVILVIVKPDLF